MKIPMVRKFKTAGETVESGLATLAVLGKKPKKAWGKSRGARNILGAAAPEFEAAKKVKWRRSPNGVPKWGCASCGWAKGVGHDRWCEYIANPQDPGVF